MIYVQILPAHSLTRKTRLGIAAALVRIDVRDLLNRRRHLRLIGDQIAIPAVCNQVGQSSRRKRDNRRAARHRLHGDQRAGFGNEAWYKETSGSAKKPSFSLQPYRPKKAMTGRSIESHCGTWASRADVGVRSTLAFITIGGLNQH